MFVCREHEEADDARLGKHVQDVVEGRVRSKRRHGGLGLDESDSEDEDEGARNLRRKQLNKRRKIVDDKLEDLGTSCCSTAIMNLADRAIGLSSWGLHV